jgi:hypothetical protein
MYLTVSGIPGAKPSYTFNNSGAVLGRMQGQNVHELTVPLPHIEQGPQTTTGWSRRHVQFDVVDGMWMITLLSSQPTQLNGQPLVQNRQVQLPGSAQLSCGQLTLELSWESPDNRFATIGPGQAPPALDPGQTIGPGQAPRPLRPIPISPPVWNGPPRPLPPGQPPAAGGPGLQAVSMDGMAEQVRTLLEQSRNELGRASASAHDAQQRRVASETARDEAKQAIVDIQNALSREQVLAAANRASEAAAKTRAHADRAANARESARRASQQAEEGARRLRTLADDIARTASSLPHRAPERAQLDQHARDAETAAAQGERNAEQSREKISDAERAAELIAAAAKTAAGHSEEAQSLAARRAGELARRDRARLYLQRYGFVALILLVAVAVGLLVGYALESANDGGNPPSLSAGSGK